MIYKVLRNETIRRRIHRYLGIWNSILLNIAVLPKKYVGKELWCNNEFQQCALRRHPQYDIIDLLSKVIVTWFLGRFQDPKFKQVYIQWKIGKKAWSKSLCLKAGIHTIWRTNLVKLFMKSRICKASDWLSENVLYISISCCKCSYPVFQKVGSQIEASLSLASISKSLKTFWTPIRIRDISFCLAWRYNVL